MSNPFSAIFVDDSNDKQLISIIKSDLEITRVKKYTNTIDALDAIEHYKGINLVFIDYETVLDSTYSFVEKACATKNCKNTKFILLASHSNKKMLSRAANIGISAFILKPYKKQKLLEKVRKLLPKIEEPVDIQLDLLESIEATLRFKGKEILGGIVNISHDGCAITTKRYGRMGVEIYDIVTIRVNFENEKLGINAEVVRMEKDEERDEKSITTTFKFTKPNDDNAMQFAKFWAFILKERDKI